MSKILVAALEDTDFEFWADEGEWEECDVAERTRRILKAHALWKIDQIREEEALHERLVRDIDDVHLKILVWRAWLALPLWEVNVLETLGVRFVETAVEEGTRAVCLTYTDPEDDAGAPAPVIHLDPNKYTEDDEDRTFHTILHELAHASYRTADISKIFGEHVRSDDWRGFMELGFEYFCDDIADIWLKRLHKREAAKTAAE